MLSALFALIADLVTSIFGGIVVHEYSEKRKQGGAPPPPGTRSLEGMIDDAVRQYARKTGKRVDPREWKEYHRDVSVRAVVSDRYGGAAEYYRLIIDKRTGQIRKVKRGYD